MNTRPFLVRHDSSIVKRAMARMLEIELIKEEDVGTEMFDALNDEWNVHDAYGRVNRYIVWAESPFEAARMVQRYKKEHGAFLPSSYDVHRLRSEHGRIVELMDEATWDDSTDTEDFTCEIEKLEDVWDSHPTRVEL